MILAGDIGGTKTVLSLSRRSANGGLHTVQEQTFASGDFSSFDAMLTVFLPGDAVIESACFGIAGPVVEQRCFATNLGWTLDGESLKARLATSDVRLLNDLQAMAVGMLHLDDSDFVELNPGARPQRGNKAVIAAGTGLGEAMLYWDGAQHHPIATEGGHCSFAPQTPQQDRLLEYLRRLYPGHVSYERILSGIGFSHLYDFLVETGFGPACSDVPDAQTARLNDIDRNALISGFGLNGKDAVCQQAVRLFVELYGAEASNLVLKAFATGGVF
ncbi:MAG: glucokinase, partial [Methylomonas sp.]